MKLTTKLTLAAGAAILTLASSAYAGSQVQVGETDHYVVWSIQPGNGQSTTIVYKEKPAATTVALDVHNTSAGSNSATNPRSQSQDANVAPNTRVSIPGGIN